MRVIVAAEKPLAGELSLIGPDGSVAAKSRDRHGGPPYFWFTEVASPAAGTWRVNLVRDRTTSGCGTVTWMSVAGGYPDHDTADIYVQQLKLHGYNLVRFHFLDITLMENQPLTNTFNPVQLDRFYYFISALKKTGISWVLDTTARHAIWLGGDTQ